MALDAAGAASPRRFAVVVAAAIGVVALVVLLSFVDPFASVAPRGTAVVVLALFALVVVVWLLFQREKRVRAEAVVSVAEHRRLVAALEASEEQLVRTLEETKTGSWEWDVRSDRLRWSENLGPIHGLRRGEHPTSYAEYLALVHPDDRPRVASVIESALARATGYEIEFRTARPTGESRWIWAQASVITDQNQRPFRIVGLSRDISERMRREEHTNLLAAMTETLSPSFDLEQTLGEVARLAVASFADWCSIALLEDGDEGSIVDVAFAHADADRSRLGFELQRAEPPSPDGASWVSTVVRTGTSLLHSDVDDEQLRPGADGMPAAAREFGARSVLVVPLAAGGTAFGAITFVISETAHRYDASDRTFAEEFARRAALATDNVRTHRAEQEARETAETSAVQMERLQRLAAVLSASVTPAQISRILVREGSETVGAISGWVSVLSSNGELEHVASFGYDESFIEENRLIALDASHVAAEVVRSGEPCWLEKTSDASRPELRSAQRATGGEALALVPLVAVDEPLGFMALRFAAPHVFAPGERQLLLTFARQGSQALDRALRYEREREARRTAQRATELLTRLQAMTAALATAVTVQDVAEIVVDQGSAAFDADAAAVHLVGDDGTSLTLAARNDDSDDLLELWSGMSADEPLAGIDAVRRGKILWFESNESLAKHFPAHAAIRKGWEGLGLIPLVGRAGPVGLLSLNFRERRPGRRADRPLVATLGRQSGQALERARLYEHEREARDWGARLQAITAAISKASAVDGVVAVVIDDLLDSLGATDGVVALFDREGTLRQAAVRGSVDSSDDEESAPLEARFPVEEATRFGRIVVSPREAGCDIAVALRVGARLVGVLGFALPDRPDLSTAEREFLEAATAQAAQGIERGFLYDREQLARQAAERTNERLRMLEAVAQVGLAARTLDELLDDLLPLVRDLFGADRAALLLVDVERSELWMRAAVGLDEETQAEVRMPIGQGIAGTIAASGTAMLVEDLSAAHPVSEYLRTRGGSLLGVPLKSDGRVLGVLHVSSDRRSAFEDRDRRLLTLAGERIAVALERISLYEREHETAVTLQRSVLPEQMPRVDRVQLAARYLPGSTGIEVGGDWYDAIELDNGRLGIVVGDVVGKGVLAAATMTQLRNALRVYALEGLKPASVLAKLNHLADTTGPSFATLVYATVDTESLVCRYSSAGHPPPLLLRADGLPEFLEGGRSVPLGVNADVGYRQDVVQLEPGDTLVLYTDGLVERRGKTLVDGLDELESSVQGGPPELEALLDHVVSSLLDEESPRDDVAVLALRASPQHAWAFARSFPAQPSALAEARTAIRNWLELTGVPAAERDEVVLACSEACANAVEHAEDPSRLEFEIFGEKVGDEIVVRIRDFGRWREPRDTPNRGFGFRLIENMMDRVEVTANASGTEIELRRRLPMPAASRSPAG